MSTSLQNVKVKYIRPQGYQDLKEWVKDENNVYIGRSGIVFVKNGEKKERFPKRSSKWQNPFKIGKEYTRDSCLVAYKKYIQEKIKEEPDKYDLNELKGKNLGCWCHPEKCHGDILIELLEEKK